MKFEVKHKLTGKVKFVAEIECTEDADVSVKLRLAVKWAIKKSADLRYADLRYADLSYADLSYADLRYADLRYANLRYANLRSADLSSADLSYADLSYANLSYADLRYADLRYADLRYANLRSADLRYAKNLSDDVVIPTGETWGDYKRVVVPALLTAGGKKLEEVATEENWNCHSWDNCPMATAFSVHEASGIPALYRPRAEQFIQFFDANMIPLSEVLGSK